MATTKYLIFSVIFFGYAMFSYNRKGVSFAIPSLLKEGLKNEQLGLILSSQNMAYAISKFLGGIISDKLSSRVLFSTGLLISGLAAILFSSVDSVTLFTVSWFLNGLAQGVGWPAIAKLLKNWFDPTELGTWWSMASASANLAGCAAPFLASYIIMNHGWRFSLVFVGGLTILAAIVSYIFIVDSPPSSQPVKKSAQSKSTSSPKNCEIVAKKKSANALRILLATKFIWVISICYFVVSTIKTSFTDWSQMYLMKDCDKSNLVANSFVSSFEFGGFFGGIIAGYFSDMYMRHVLKGSKVLPPSGHPRMTIALLFAVVTSVCLYLFYYHVGQDSSTLFINQLGILIGGSVYAQIAIFGVVATQSVASEMSGTAHAIAALAANLGSIMAGLPFASIAKELSWSYVFFLLLAITAGQLALMLAASKVSYKIASLSDAQKKSQ